MYVNRFTADTRSYIRDVARWMSVESEHACPIRGAPPNGRPEHVTFDRAASWSERRCRYAGVDQCLRRFDVNGMFVEPVGDFLFAVRAPDGRQPTPRPRHMPRETSRCSPVVPAQPCCLQPRDASASCVIASRETRRAARCCRRRIVQLVRQTGRELAQRHHLLVLPVCRCEHPGPVHHPVDERFRDHRTLAYERRELVAHHDQRVRFYFGHDLRHAGPHSRIREHAGDVAGVPFGDLARRAPGRSQRQSDR